MLCIVGRKIKNIYIRLNIFNLKSNMLLYNQRCSDVICTFLVYNSENPACCCFDDELLKKGY